MKIKKVIHVKMTNETKWWINDTQKKPIKLNRNRLHRIVLKAESEEKENKSISQQKFLWNTQEKNKQIQKIN